MIKNETIRKRIQKINNAIEEGVSVDELKKLKRHAVNLRRIYLNNIEDGIDEVDSRLNYEICMTITCIDEFIEG